MGHIFPLIFNGFKHFFTIFLLWSLIHDVSFSSLYFTVDLLSVFCGFLWPDLICISHFLLLISAQETIHRQAVVCHRVLRRVQELAHQSQVEKRLLMKIRGGPGSPVPGRKRKKGIFATVKEGKAGSQVLGRKGCSGESRSWLTSPR
jgi:hypothetical protein